MKGYYSECLSAERLQRCYEIAPPRVKQYLAADGIHYEPRQFKPWIAGAVGKVDFFGREISDALTVCRRFPQRVKRGLLLVRMDTAGSRYIEGLDPTVSYAVLERHGRLL